MRSKAIKMKKVKSLLREKSNLEQQNSWSNRRSSRKGSFSNSLCSFKISKKATGIFSVQITDDSINFFPKGNFILEITAEDAAFNTTLQTKGETPCLYIGTKKFISSNKLALAEAKKRSYSVWCRNTSKNSDFQFNCQTRRGLKC